MDGREFEGARIVVEPGRGHRPNGPKFATRRTEHRVTIEGLDSHTSWQDLKVKSSWCSFIFILLVSFFTDLFFDGSLLFLMIIFCPPPKNFY